MEDFNLDFLKIYSQNDNAVLADLLKSNGKYDIIDSIINNELNKIKAMIGKSLSVEKTKTIDSEFFESLKKYFIVKGKELSENELQDLSYFYFAIYNNTVDVYYKIKASSDVIFYFMLDENVYNNINNNTELDFNKLNSGSQKLLQIAYDYGIFDQVLNIFKLNPEFESSEYKIKETVLQHPGFKLMIEYFGVEFLAECNNYSLIGQVILNNDIEYLKELLTINPCIDLSNNIILNKQVRNIFSTEQLAKFSSTQLQNLKGIISDHALYRPFRFFSKRRELCEKILNYYAEIIKINPYFILYDDNDSLIYLILNNDEELCPANVLALANKDLQIIIYELYSNYDNAYYSSSSVDNLINARYYKNKIHHLIKRETKRIESLSPNDLVKIDPIQQKSKLYLKK